MLTYKIILPDLSKDLSQRLCGSLVSMWSYSHCLMSIPVLYPNVSVVCNNDALLEKVSHILVDAPCMSNKGNELAGLFAVNDHIFLMRISDTPNKNAHKWVPYYSKYVSGFFLLCHRRSTAYIFDNCDIPVFPLTIKPDVNLPLAELELDAHSKSVTIKKDISVFFRGRYNTRLPRKILAAEIQNRISKTHISDSRNFKKMPGTEYIDLMCRSKIAWCPRSVKCLPDTDCNAACPRESEAMCLECLVVRPNIGIIEAEERISGVHFVEIKNDSSDLIEKLQYYLEHENKRKEIAHNGRLWWERNSSHTARARQIFSDCVKAIESKKA